MIFALETLAARAPQHVGPKIKEYIKKVQDRYVVFSPEVLEMA